jgi:hypothetical protein
VTDESQWHRVKAVSPIYQWKEGKVGDLVKTWYGLARLEEGEIIVQKPNGDITLIEKAYFLADKVEIET